MPIQWTFVQASLILWWGSAFFIILIAMLKLFRKLTPSARTVDERPFTGNDIKRLKNSTEWNPEMCFCGILEAPAAVLTSVLMPGRSDNCVLRAADWVEQRMHRAGLLDSWNQYVLINLVKRP
jgi:hypothetical protein